MSNIALARINSLPDVPTQEEPIFVLTSSELQDIITRTIQPLQDRIESLEATITSLDTNVSALESTQEHDVNRICLDICQDRQRLARLESRPSTAPAPIVPPKG